MRDDADRNSLWHLGVYHPRKKRATIHDGHVRTRSSLHSSASLSSLVHYGRSVCAPESETHLAPSLHLRHRCRRPSASCSSSCEVVRSIWSGWSAHACGYVLTVRDFVCFRVFVWQGFPSASRRVEGGRVLYTLSSTARRRCVSALVTADQRSCDSACDHEKTPNITGGRGAIGGYAPGGP